MVRTNWTVNLAGQARKAFKELPRDTAKTFRLLLEDLELNGYQRHNWPNFSKLKESIYHCHLVLDFVNNTVSGCVKAPGLKDRKGGHIINIAPFPIF